MVDEPKKDTIMWYLLPVLFSFVGGIVMYFALRKKDNRMAKNGFIVGLVFTAIVLTVRSVIFGSAMFD